MEYADSPGADFQRDGRRFFPRCARICINVVNAIRLDPDDFYGRSENLAEPR